jgi:hypothetical protein
LPLLERLHSAFSDDAFEQGWSLFEVDAVEMAAIGSASVEAEVVGSKGTRYEVGLYWGDIKRKKVVFAACTCPQARRAACKHICAVLVWLGEVQETEIGPPGFTQLRLDLIPPQPFKLLANDPTPPSHWRSVLAAFKPRRPLGLSPSASAPNAGGQQSAD